MLSLILSRLCTASYAGALFLLATHRCTRFRNRSRGRGSRAVLEVPR